MSEVNSSNCDIADEELISDDGLTSDEDEARNNRCFIAMINIAKAQLRIKEGCVFIPEGGEDKCGFIRKQGSLMCDQHKELINERLTQKVHPSYHSRPRRVPKKKFQNPTPFPKAPQTERKSQEPNAPRKISLATIRRENDQEYYERTRRVNGIPPGITEYIDKIIEDFYPTDFPEIIEDTVALRGHFGDKIAGLFFACGGEVLTSSSGQKYKIGLVKID